MAASSRARAHLAAVASAPRPAGGEAEARARAYCASTLRSVGFEVRELPFTYSDVVGRFGMPIAGGVWAAAVAIAALAGTRGHPAASLLVLVGALASVARGARWATRHGVLAAPMLRRRSINLVATRGAAAPAVWLVAHLDSKSQPVPMAARVAGVATSMVLWAGAIVVAVLQLAGADVIGAWGPLAVAGVVGALPVLGSGIGARSPGAIDNGSGLATVLLAAEGALDAPALPNEVGVLLTSGEEVGLAGARAWAECDESARLVETGRTLGIHRVALNVDSVDDHGVLRVMTASRLPAALDDAITAERDVRRRHLPAGVLVDAIALADAGWAALTVSKGTIGTLARIHTRGDSLGVLRGDGVVDAARLVCRLAASVQAGGIMLDRDHAAD